MKRILSHPLFWIIAASILPVLSLLHSGMPYVHDGQDHVTRIANFYAVLKEGTIVPRWAPNLNWGYGHPVLMFLYPLPEYLASVFHFVGFSLVDSTKLVFGLAFIASTVTMYLWMSAAFGIGAGTIGALLYTFAPYRFVDLHVRGALGEHVAFVFPPLIMYFLWKLTRPGMTIRATIHITIGAALCTAALILSHNALALMFLPVIGLYGLYLFIAETKNKWRYVLSGIAVLIGGFVLSAFFWVPALAEGKFTLRDIVTAGGALTRFVPWTQFIYSPWNWGGGEDMSKSLGIAQWVGVAASVYLIFRHTNKKLVVLVTGFIVLLLCSLLIMTSYSAFIWRLVKILQNFQFPWRFLSLSVFLSAVIGGIAADWFLGAFRLKPQVYTKIFITFCVMTVIITINMWRPKGYQYRDESFYTGMYPGTTDTGESTPVWSVRFMEHAPDNPLDVIDGDASVTVGKRISTEHEYTITVRKPTLMLENTLYFPGWKIYINGVQTAVEWQNPDYRGLMTFRVVPGDTRVRVVFVDTKIRKTANMVSAAGFMIAGVAGIGVMVWQKRKRYR